MSLRTERVSSLIKQEMGFLLSKLELPAITTVNKVEVTPDLKQGKIWLTVLTEEEKVEQAVLKVVNSNIYELQGEINNKFEMRNVPRIRFLIDHSEQYADHINKLLKQTKEE
ncbi:MAG: 30S ribosome-binding factor RbfA [Candidatus Doudnabacteria bacterium]|nr:30S ribosome-binding factor RbfA [Candidatus Doudnabacteria bacterium]